MEEQGAAMVHVVRKFWVLPEDVTAVLYFILQHLPLVPTGTAAAARERLDGGRGWGWGGGGRVRGQEQQRQQDEEQQQQQQQQEQEKQQGQQQQRKQQQQHQKQQGQQQQQQAQQQQTPQQQQQQLSLDSRTLAAAAAAAGAPAKPLLHPQTEEYASEVHTVYFDNRVLELYHGRLYLRPHTIMLKALWKDNSGDDSSSSSSSSSSGSSSSGADKRGWLGEWAPENVVLERKICREGWKGRLCFLMRQKVGLRGLLECTSGTQGHRRTSVVGQWPVV